jgi:hypothetical protein
MKKIVIALGLLSLVACKKQETPGPAGPKMGEKDYVWKASELDSIRVIIVDILKGNKKDWTPGFITFQGEVRFNKKYSTKANYDIWQIEAPVYHINERIPKYEIFFNGASVKFSLNGKQIEGFWKQSNSQEYTKMQSL